MHSRLVFDRTKVSLQKTVEKLWLCPGIASTTVGASDVLHRFWSATLFLFEGFLEVIRPKSLVAASALNKWVNKLFNVAGGFPNSSWKNYRGIKTDNILTAIYNRAPPLALDVFF